MEIISYICNVIRSLSALRAASGESDGTLPKHAAYGYKGDYIKNI